MAHDTFTHEGYLFYETSFKALNNSGVEGRVLAVVDHHAQSVTFDIKGSVSARAGEMLWPALAGW